MKITNHYNLPNAIVRSLESNYEYKDKRYSVTSLLNPVRETLLKRRYHDEIETDAVDMIWALWGTGIHKMLENQNEDGELSEQQLEHQFSNGYTLSGYADFIDLNNNEILDYKSTSVYQFNNQDSHEKWKKQLQMYMYLYYKMSGVHIPTGKIWLFMRDWSKGKLLQGYDYPKHPVMSLTFDLGKPNDIEEWIHENLDLLIKNETVHDDDLPLCSMKERWNNGDQYAVMKQGNKRAVKLHKDLEEAEAHVANLGFDYYVEIRKGVDRKCLDYCSANVFCNYYKTNYGEE